MSMYGGGLTYDDLGTNMADDPSQPAGPADQAESPNAGGGGVSLPSLNVNHGIAIIFIAALSIYSGAAYWFFRRINQAV